MSTPTPTPTPHRIVFLHGLEGSPNGTKPGWLRTAGHAVTAPLLETRALVAAFMAGAPPTPDLWAEALETASRTVTDARPDVVVGSSFGGGLALELMHRGLWRGPAVLLAPAGRKLFGRSALPAGHAPVAILHGRRDDVIPVADSVSLAADSTGEVTLTLVDDDHRLHIAVQAGWLGRLVEAVVSSQAHAHGKER